MNPIVQSLTQFTGYFNMIANLSFTNYQKIVKDEFVSWEWEYSYISFCF